MGQAVHWPPVTTAQEGFTVIARVGGVGVVRGGRYFVRRAKVTAEGGLTACQVMLGGLVVAGYRNNRLNWWCRTAQPTYGPSAALFTVQRPPPPASRIE